MPNRYDDLSEDELADRAGEMQTILKEMETEIQKGFIGQEDTLHKILLGIAAGGNVLLEGVPGLGKSLLVELLAQVVEGTDFNRIQFTPDLLPADITGVEAYNEDKGFYVEKGPIFANFILADEINRAPPKVQSAMLEAMQEHKVSIGDEDFRLPEPFFTMATQNPIEQGGSLHPDETLYMDGRLWKASEAIEHSRENGKKVDEEEDRRIYDAGGTTSSLSSDGKLNESNAMVYEKDYEGEIYTVKTRTGRRIKVNGDHPFLVNANGKMKWRKAEELEEDDFLVTPETLELPEKEFPSHQDVIEKLEEEFQTATPGEVREARENLKKGTWSRQDIDRLRMAADMDKKELAAESGVSYDRVLNYLQDAENGAGQELVEAVDRKDTGSGTYIESYRVHEISCSWGSEEAGFFTGFTLAEGSIEDNSIEVSQKNYPELIERWISLAEEAGLQVYTREKNGVKHAKVHSKPFVRYLEERYSISEPGRLLNAPGSFKREFIDAFMQAESYFENDREEDNIRITMTQQDRRMVNIISHMLTGFGIRPSIYDQDSLYRLRVSGKDLIPYMDMFTWPGKEPEVEEGASAYRVVPVNSGMVDRVVTNLGLKNSGDMKHQDWFPIYKMAKERERVSEYGLQNFIEAMDDKLEERHREEPDSVQEKALNCGIAMTEVVEETELSKHRVWQGYKQESLDQEAEEFVEREREIRLEKTGKMLSYLRKLLDSDVFYDPVQEIEVEDYGGPVIGLSVPENHNYVAGLGACGINHNTYPLPEAQIDRFLFKLFLGYPEKKNEKILVDKNADIMDEEDYGIEEVVTEQDINNLQEFSKQVIVRDEIKAYIVDLVDASRNPEDYGMELAEYIDWGCTPRASINLALGGRANALYNGRHYVTPEDIRDVIEDVFIHRIILNYEGEAADIEVSEIIQNIVDRVPVR